MSTTTDLISSKVGARIAGMLTELVETMKETDTELAKEISDKTGEILHAGDIRRLREHDTEATLTVDMAVCISTMYGWKGHAMTCVIGAAPAAPAAPAPVFKGKLPAQSLKDIDEEDAIQLCHAIHYDSPPSAEVYKWLGQLGNVALTGDISSAASGKPIKQPFRDADQVNLTQICEFLSKIIYGGRFEGTSPRALANVLLLQAEINEGVRFPGKLQVQKAKPRKVAAMPPVEEQPELPVEPVEAVEPVEPKQPSNTPAAVHVPELKLLHEMCVMWEMTTITGHNDVVALRDRMLAKQCDPRAHPNWKHTENKEVIVEDAVKVRFDTAPWLDVDTHTVMRGTTKVVQTKKAEKTFVTYEDAMQWMEKVEALDKSPDEFDIYLDNLKSHEVSVFMSFFGLLRMTPRMYSDDGSGHVFHEQYQELDKAGKIIGNNLADMVDAISHEHYQRTLDEVK